MLKTLSGSNFIVKQFKCIRHMKTKNSRFYSFTAKGSAFALGLVWAAISPASIAALDETMSKPITVKQALSFSHVEDSAGSPSGTISWATKQNGVREVWASNYGDIIPKKLTSFVKDDGKPVTSLSISDDGHHIVFVRGAYSPNTLSLIKPPMQKIWFSNNLEEAAPLVTGNLPVLSPDGNTLIYENMGAWYKLSLVEKESKPEVIFNVSGKVHTPVFDPSGNSIAFVSDRGNHAMIGLFTFGEDAIRWIEPSLSRDLFPTWSPDGKSLAFLRYPGRQFNTNDLFLRSSPFEIRIANIESDEGELLWSSPSADGGYVHEIGTPISWVSDDKIVFQSEHTGWASPFAITISDKNIIPLMPAGCEMTHSTIQRASNHLIYSSNCGDRSRRHLWRANIETGHFEQITHGQGIELRPVSAGPKGEVAFTASDFNSSTHLEYLNAENQRKTFIPKDEPWPYSDEYIQPEEITFEAEDGSPVFANIIRPDGKWLGKGKRPAVIFLHGGPYRQMMLGWHELGYYSNAYALNQHLVSKGYVVLNLNYRSGTGYGRDFRMAEKQGPEGASEYQDMVAAAKYLIDNAHVDTKKIGLWGGSHGGVMVAWGLARNSDLFAAGVDISGVHDWRQYAREQLGVSEDVLNSEQGTIMDKASPINDIEGWASPVLIVSGDNDHAVFVSQSIDLAEKIKNRGIVVEQLLLPDELHDFARHDSWLTIGRKTIDFFDRWLLSVDTK